MKPSGSIQDDVTEETLFLPSFEGQLGKHLVNRVRMTLERCTSVKTLANKTRKQAEARGRRLLDARPRSTNNTLIGSDCDSEP